MKKVLLSAFVFVLAVIGSLGYLYTKKPHIIQDSKILAPIVKTSIKNQTPEERFSMIENSVKEHMLAFVKKSFSDNSPQWMESRGLTKSMAKQLFEIESNNIPYQLLGSENIGVNGLKISVQSDSKSDLSKWWHQRASGNMMTTISAKLTPELSPKVGTATPELKIGGEVIVDGANTHVKLNELSSNMPALPLDAPQYSGIVNEIKDRWILINEAMLDPASKGIDPNKSSEIFVEKMEKTLEENIDSLSLWKKPIKSKKEGEWYIFSLEFDKELATKSIQKLSKDVVESYISSTYYTDTPENKQAQEDMRKELYAMIEKMNLSVLDHANFEFIVHETDLDKWLLKSDISMGGEYASVLEIDNRQEDASTGSIVVTQTSNNGIKTVDKANWMFSDKSVSITALAHNGTTVSINGNYNGKTMIATAALQGKEVANIQIEKTADKYWSGKVIIPEVKSEEPMLTWNMNNSNFDSMLWIDNEAAIKTNGSYSPKMLKVNIDLYSQEANEVGINLANIDFSKKQNIWNGDVSIYENILQLKTALEVFNGKSKGMNTKTDFYILGIDGSVLTLTMNNVLTALETVDIDVPTESTPLTEILEAFGVPIGNNPYGYDEYDPGNPEDYNSEEYEALGL